MKHLTPTLAKLFAILFLMLAVACSSNDEDPPQDSPGTRTVEMLYTNNNGIQIGSYHTHFLLIASDNTFKGRVDHSDWEFVSVGPVSGINEITEIPKTGWTRDLEIVPGNGYVVCSHTGNYINFSRLYAVEYTKNYDYISGIRVKVQDAFNGSAKEIGLSHKSVFLDAMENEGYGNEASYNSQNIFTNHVSMELMGPHKYWAAIFFENSRLGIRIYKAEDSPVHNQTFVFSSKGLPNEELQVTP